MIDLINFLQQSNGTKIKATQVNMSVSFAGPSIPSVLYKMSSK